MGQRGVTPEIHECSPDAVDRPRIGQIYAWNNPKWVEGREKTGRKTRLTAGTLPSTGRTRLFVGTSVWAKLSKAVQRISKEVQ